MAEAKFCPHCGSPLAAGDRYCGNCGAIIAAATTPPGTSAVSGVPKPAGKRRWGMTSALVAGGAVLAIAAVLVAGSGDKETRPPAQPPAMTDGEKGDVDRPAAPAQHRWETYANARYATRIDYPADMFVAQAATGDNAGRSFEAADGAGFFVYSSANALEQTLDDLIAENLAEAGDRLLAHDRSANGFHLVFRRENQVIDRTLATSDGLGYLHWFEVAYPEEKASTYAPISKRMRASFSVAAVTDQPGQGGASSGGTVALLPLIGWTYKEPAADFADLPALTAEVEFGEEADMGQLTFVCQQTDPSTAYFALLVAPAFAPSDEFAATITIEGSGGAGTVSLAMRDLYATTDGERPNINWDATILFAPIELEDLSVLVQAQGLIVSAAGRSWRLDTMGLAGAGEEFLTACESGGVQQGGIHGGPDAFSYVRIASSERGFGVAGVAGPVGFAVDIPEAWVREENTLEHELVFRSPDSDLDAQMFLAFMGEPLMGRTPRSALAEQVAEMQSMADAQIVEQGPVETAAGPGERVILRFASPAGPGSMLMDETIVLRRGDILYRIELTAPEAIWHTANQAMQRVVQTLEFAQ
ncbi:MAG: zinc ribbon domain-containing protein [Rhodobiaceae bacterium]|nr:zinc ribbon domain-containing protein [Rhodobiaceae bacterium]